MTQKERYQKFKETKQEKLRLELALEGFFSEETLAEGATEDRAAYGNYLKLRIRPAMERLIKEGDLRKMEGLAAQGWIGSLELEHLIETALQQENNASLLWLMHYKNRTYGFTEKEWGWKS